MADEANIEDNNEVVEAEDMFDQPEAIPALDKPEDTLAEKPKEGDEHPQDVDPKAAPKDVGEEEKPIADDPEKPAVEGDQEDKPVDPEEPVDPKEAARKDYAQRHPAKSLDDRVSDVKQSELRKQEELDPEDPDYRVKKLESENEIRKAEDEARQVRENQMSLARDGDAVQKNISMFRPTNDDGTPNGEFNSAAYEAAIDEFARVYTVESDDKDPNDRIILGAFDPRTGQPVSFYQFMKDKSEQFAKIAGTSAQKASQDTRNAERKMRSAGDPVGGGGTPHKESADEKEAREMSEAFKH